MSGKQSNLQPILRQKVREVLAALPDGRRATEEVVLTGVRALGWEARDAEILDALEWNHNRGLVDFAHNYDFDRDEWFLTERGREKDE